MVAAAEAAPLGGGSGVDPAALVDAPAVLLAGPTASGKSALALRLAEEAMRRGRAVRIVNADSMQVYAGLSVLTARPSAADEARLQHCLYGHVPATKRYSTGAWLVDTGAALEEAAAALPIFAGGTGLYFKALTQGIADIPVIPEAIRARWSARLRREGAAALHDVLGQHDPGAAEMLAPGDSQRIVRALEVLEATGMTIGERRRRFGMPPLVAAEAATRLVLETPPEVLRSRIDARVERMAAEGALAEVAALLDQGIDPALPAMKAIGVREFGAALRGESTLAAALEAVKAETRRYAKRQRTWFRGQMAGWMRIAA